MDYIKVLIETDLSDAINAFYELDDRKISHEYAREYFAMFCRENGCDRLETYNFLKQVLRKRLENSKISDKNKFKGLEQAILTSTERDILHPKREVYTTEEHSEDEGR